MNKAVVDASVAIKWVVPEPYSGEAESLLAEGAALLAPGHWAAEVTTALWAKSAVHGALTRQQATERMAWIASLAIEVVPVDRLILAATSLAFDLRATAYDTLYLALAEQRGTPLVTADRKLYDKVRASSRFDGLIVWVADLTSGATA